MGWVKTSSASSRGILAEEGYCSLGHVASDHLDDAFSKLVSFGPENEIEDPVSEEDIKTGFELFYMIVYCPPLPIIKLLRFVDKLVSTESTRTVIQTFVSLFQSGILKDLTSFSLAKEFYGVLASVLNLQYGNILLATSTRSQLQAVIDNDWPFFTNYTELVKKCLKHSECDNAGDVLQKQGQILS